MKSLRGKGFFWVPVPHMMLLDHGLATDFKHWRSSRRAWSVVTDFPPTTPSDWLVLACTH